MTELRSKLWLGELIWWLLTVVLLVLVLLPIYQRTTGYSFYLLNAVYLVIFVTFTRYIFLWKTHPLSRSKAFNFLLVLSCIPIFIYSIGGLNDFQIFLDDYGLVPFVSELSLSEQGEITKYITNQMLFFGVGAIICSLALPIRLLISRWRMRNRGTV